MIGPGSVLVGRCEARVGQEQSEVPALSAPAGAGLVIPVILSLHYVKKCRLLQNEEMEIIRKFLQRLAV